MSKKFIDQLRHKYSGKNVLIFGLGLLGRGIGDTRFFYKLGANIRVTDIKPAHKLTKALDQIKDLNNISYTLGKHEEKDIDWADVIVRNASVPWDHRLLDLARQQKKAIVMDTQLFVQYTGIFSIGITGTRGKTTTSYMIHHILKDHSPKKILLGGNIIGVATLPLMEEIDDPTEHIAVLELSSWQLQAFKQSKISPNIAVITNIYPDHLNTYTSMKEYTDDKKAIITHQRSTDHAFFNADQKDLFSSWESLTKATSHWFSNKYLPQNISLDVIGPHNLQNAAAAYAVTAHLGISEEKVAESLSTFKGIPFRLEEIATSNNIKVFNDTTSTTPIALSTAIKSFDAPITLIMGGTDKKLPLKNVIININHEVDQIILLPGTGTDRIKPHLDPFKIILETSSLKKAFIKALSASKSGDIILFSPGFTSFGLFHNEFDRGEQFNQVVRDCI